MTGLRNELGNKDHGYQGKALASWVQGNLLAPDRINDYNDQHDYMGRKIMSTHSWSVAEAKAKFSEVMEKAQSDGPQTITRNGRKAVVVVAADEWERKTKRKGNLAEFLMASPFRGSGIEIKRLRGRLR